MLSAWCGQIWACRATGSIGSVQQQLPCLQESHRRIVHCFKLFCSDFVLAFVAFRSKGTRRWGCWAIAKHSLFSYFFVIFCHLSMFSPFSTFKIADFEAREEIAWLSTPHSKKYCNKYFDQFWLGLVSVRKVWQLQSHILTRRRAARLLDKTMQFFNAVDLSRPF